MKLIDILVRELPRHGGWPEWATECMVHQGCMLAIFYDSDGYFSKYPEYPVIGFDRKAINSVTVTREQYEAALAASKTEWNGEGLPPVGLVCEGQFPRHPGISFEWQECLVLYVFERECAVKSKGTSTLHYCDEFRPIRSEADKKREIGVLSLARSDPTVGRFEYGQKMGDGKLLGYAWYELYDKIAAGEVAGIRID